MFGPLLGALVIASILVAIFALAFKFRGPWGSIWTFFLVLFLGIWAFTLWARPVEGRFWGIEWLPAVIVGLLIAFLLAAVVPPSSPPPGAPRRPSVEVGDLPEESKGAVNMGIFFWLLLVLLILAIVIASI